MVQYVLVTELETTDFTSCKVQGLLPSDLTKLERNLPDLQINYSNQENFFEVDMQGIKLINLLASSDFGYRICSQSMVIENSKIGGRINVLQKIIWTLYKE